jgi:hypothetical protein
MRSGNCCQKTFSWNEKIISSLPNFPLLESLSFSAVGDSKALYKFLELIIRENPFYSDLLENMVQAICFS